RTMFASITRASQATPLQLIQNRNKTAAERCWETHSAPAAALLLRTQNSTILSPDQAKLQRPARRRGGPGALPFPMQKPHRLLSDFTVLKVPVYRLAYARRYITVLYPK